MAGSLGGQGQLSGCAAFGIGSQSVPGGAGCSGRAGAFASVLGEVEQAFKLASFVLDHRGRQRQRPVKVDTEAGNSSTRINPGDPKAGQSWKRSSFYLVVINP
jgi:hypothetical protein